MNKLFWKALKVAPVLFAASLFAASGASAQAVNDTLQQINNYQTQDQNDSLSQVTNVNQLRDVSPTDWAYEALRSLVDRYGCIAGFPNQTYRGSQALTRYEFAAGLNSCLNQIERLIASSEAVSQEDLDTINRLTQEFEAELATLGGRVDELESRTAILEDNQFSTTTKLNGEVIFTIADVFGDEVGNIDSVSDAQTTFSDRVRLNFDTSFYGEDRLRTRLEAGNFEQLDGDVTGTASTRLGHDAGGDNDIEVSDLHYRFPLNDRIRGWVGTAGLDLDDIFDVANPMLESSGSGALSRFSRRNPLLFRGTEGAGAGVNLELIEDKLGVNALYLANDANDPGNGEGLFNGSFSAGGQVVFSPFEALEVSATYVRNFQSGDDVDQAGDTVGLFEDIDNDVNTPDVLTEGFAAQPFGETDTTANKIGAGVTFDLNERMIIAGWGGFSDVTGLVDGNDNNLDGEIWTWGANVSFLDLGREGSKLSIAGGMLPKFISDDAVNENQNGLQEDRDTSYLVEALYSFPVNDNIAITPGAYVVFNPNHDEDNDNVYVGVIRTTFKF
ncbi:iron uptake porin [Pleurocapsa sp. PCC 7319]|uniref:iron uptake porin n=1 Tax=Pleurocapsa sp. PCC 7319 TaxID=118161 RepID=UPI00034538C3|nr:iron uptake porin [Pleurocapsa sp. PCC 7319]